MNAGRIVVGVDDSPGARSAVAWAVDECSLRGCELVLLHAPTPQDQRVIGKYGEPGMRAVDAFAARVLDELTVYASTRRPSVAVTSRLTHSSAGDALVDVSADTELVVVGTRGAGNLNTLLGSVSRHVAAHARSPVAVVPESPTLRSAHVGGTAPVVVGIAETRAGRHALRCAFDEARLHACPVTAVLGVPGGPAVPAGSATGTRAPLEILEHALGDLATEYADVTLRPVVVNQEPGVALLEAAQHARLLVIGCHHSDDQWSTRLGPVTSTLLHRAPCPVIVIGGSSAGYARGSGYRDATASAS
jgi:nucleotide-binding universal stress UspA family protein